VSAQAKSHSLGTATLVKIAGACAALGIASSLTEYSDYGRWLTVLGVLLLLVGLHRFGRSGPDAVIYFEVEPPARKKKKKKKGTNTPLASETNDTDG
jgi:hypothetical protein